MMNRCHIALGANLPSATGAAQETLKVALKLFDGESLCVVLKSKWYQTPAYPAGSGSDFVNGVVAVDTHLDPVSVLSALHRIEAGLGRVRRDRWGPRVIDLDLIDHGRAVLPDRDRWQAWADLAPEDQQTRAPDDLILPHPRMTERSFVLYPLRDVAPDWTHPVTGRAVSDLIADLPASIRAEISAIS